MKRTLALILTLTILLSLFSFGINADEVDDLFPKSVNGNIRIGEDITLDSLAKHFGLDIIEKDPEDEKILLVSAKDKRIKIYTSRNISSETAALSRVITDTDSNNTITKVTLSFNTGIMNNPIITWLVFASLYHNNGRIKGDWTLHFLRSGGNLADFAANGREEKDVKDLLELLSAIPTTDRDVALNLLGINSNVAVEIGTDSGNDEVLNKETTKRWYYILYKLREIEEGSNAFLAITEGAEYLRDKLLREKVRNISIDSVTKYLSEDSIKKLLEDIEKGKDSLNYLYDPSAWTDGQSIKDDVMKKTNVILAYALLSQKFNADKSIREKAESVIKDIVNALEGDTNNASLSDTLLTLINKNASDNLYKPENNNAIGIKDAAAMHLNFLGRLFSIYTLKDAANIQKHTDFVDSIAKGYNLTLWSSQFDRDTINSEMEDLKIFMSNHGIESTSYDLRLLSRKASLLRKFITIEPTNTEFEWSKYSQVLRVPVNLESKTFPPEIPVLQGINDSNYFIIRNLEAYASFMSLYDTVLERLAVLSGSEDSKKVLEALHDINKSNSSKMLELYQELKGLSDIISVLQQYREIMDQDSEMLVTLWEDTTKMDVAYRVPEYLKNNPKTAHINTWKDLMAFFKTLDFDEKLSEASETEIKENPFKQFLDLKTEKLQSNVVKGISVSALYEPFIQRINEYNAFNSIQDGSFWREFLLKYGNHRKAVLLDSTTMAPQAVDTSKMIGNLRVATLRDLVEYPDEVVLTVDPSYYNLYDFMEENPEVKFMSDDLKGEDVETKEEGTLANRIVTNAQKSMDRAVSKLVPDVLEQVEGTITSFGTWIKDWFTDKPNKMNQTLLTPDGINDVLNIKEYTNTLGFAVTSAVFRDKEFAQYLQRNSSSTNKIIFMSSRSLIESRDAVDKKSAFINYIQLKNSIGNLPIDAEIRADLDKPLYVDIFGNIVSESGYIIIPVMTNATLQKKWNPLTVGFLSTFNKNGFYVELTEDTNFLLKDYNAFTSKTPEELNIVEKPYKDFKNIIVLQNRVEGGVIDLDNLSTQNSSTRDRILKLARSSIGNGGMDNGKYFANVFCEVMRGAPLSKIDKKRENLNTQADLLGFSKGVAWKFERFREKLYEGNTNSVLSTPNILFVENLGIPLAIWMKVTFLISIILILVLIFTVGMKGKFSIKKLGTIMLTAVLAIVFTVAMPIAYSVSLYETNRMLLQEPILRTALLSLAKEQEGREVNLLGQAVNYTSDTDIYIKLESIKPDIVGFAKNALDLPLREGLTTIWTDMLNQSTAKGVPNFEVKADGIYISLSNLIGSSKIAMGTNSKMLLQYQTGDTSSSFYLPYYAFVEALLNRINTYTHSEQGGNLSYSFKLFKGSVKATGYIKSYLLSDEFAKKEDIFYLKTLYKEQDQVILTPDGEGGFMQLEGVLEPLPYAEVDKEGNNIIKNSLWYNDNISIKGVQVRTEKLDEYIKSVVYQNKELIGKVDDETFVRFIAICAAMKYNQLFSIPSATTLDVRQLNNDDFVRFCIAPIHIVESNMSSSFAKFVYDVSSDIGVYFGAFLEMLLYANGWLRYIFAIAMFILYYFTLFIKKVVIDDLRDRNTNEDRVAGIKAALFLIIAVVLVNIAYAIGLWLSYKVPNLNLGPVTSIMFLIVLQAVYLVTMLAILVKVIQGWADLGYSTMRQDLKVFREKLFTGIKDLSEKLKSPNLKDNTGVKELEKLRERDKKRKELGLEDL